MDGLGCRIKQARGVRSQEDFASFLGFDRSTIASWEVDRREPSLEHLIKIADLSQVSLDWLAGRENFDSIEQAQSYSLQRWRSIIQLAISNNLSPNKIISLIKVALALKA